MYSFALIHYDLSLSPRKTAYFLTRRIGRYEDELTCTHTHFTVETYKKTCGRDFRTTSCIYHAYLFRLYLYQLFVWNSMKLLDAYIYIINVWDCMVLDLWSKLPFQVFSVTSVEGKTRVVVRGPDVKSLVIFKYVADATNMVFIKHDSFNFHLWPSRHKGNQLLHSNPSHALTPDQKSFK